ncbi:MAG: phosphomannomutase, partial [Rhodanobacter sp.]
AQQRAYPCSGEINFRVTDAAAVIDRIMNFYRDQEPLVDTTDGISLEFAEWRFNLRVSNTEPLLRLNVESRKDEGLLQRQLSQLKTL